MKTKTKKANLETTESKPQVETTERKPKVKKASAKVETKTAKAAAEKERRIANAKLAKEQKAALAPARAELKKRKEAAKTKRVAAAKAPANTSDKGAEKRETKGGVILTLLQRKGGATSAELMEASGWQRHSVRGYISAVVAKKLGHKVTTGKNEAGEFTYAISAKA